MPGLPGSSIEVVALVLQRSHREYCCFTFLDRRLPYYNRVLRLRNLMLFRNGPKTDVILKLWSRIDGHAREKVLRTRRGEDQFVSMSCVVFSFRELPIKFARNGEIATVRAPPATKIDAVCRCINLDSTATPVTTTMIGRPGAKYIRLSGARAGL